MKKWETSNTCEGQRTRTTQYFIHHDIKYKRIVTKLVKKFLLWKPTVH